jgi:hypothetical protein
MVAMRLPNMRVRTTSQKDPAVYPAPRGCAFLCATPSAHGPFLLYAVSVHIGRTTAFVAIAESPTVPLTQKPDSWVVYTHTYAFLYFLFPKLLPMPSVTESFSRLSNILRCKCIFTGFILPRLPCLPFVLVISSIRARRRCNLPLPLIPT